MLPSLLWWTSILSRGVCMVWIQGWALAYGEPFHLLDRVYLSCEIYVIISPCYGWGIHTTVLLKVWYRNTMPHLAAWHYINSKRRNLMLLLLGIKRLIINHSLGWNVYEGSSRRCLFGLSSWIFLCEWQESGPRTLPQRILLSSENRFRLAALSKGDIRGLTWPG